MFSLASRIVPNLVGKPNLHVNCIALQRNKICTVIQRWSSFQPMGSAPSQLPTPGEPGWNALINNIKKYADQPPLSPAEVLHGREMYQLSQRFNKMENMFSEVMQSNESLRKEIQQLIQKLSQ